MDKKPKPIHRRRVVPRTCYNIPHEGPLTPRLCATERTYAIGFTAKVGDDHDHDHDDEDEA